MSVVDLFTVSPSYRAQKLSMSPGELLLQLGWADACLSEAYACSRVWAVYARLHKAWSECIATRQTRFSRNTASLQTGENRFLLGTVRSKSDQQIKGFIKRGIKCQNLDFYTKTRKKYTWTFFINHEYWFCKLVLRIIGN